MLGVAGAGAAELAWGVLAVPDCAGLVGAVRASEEIKLVRIVPNLATLAVTRLWGHLTYVLSWCYFIPIMFYIIHL